MSPRHLHTVISFGKDSMEHGKSASIRLTDYPGICHWGGLFVVAL